MSATALAASCIFATLAAACSSSNGTSTSDSAVSTLSVTPNPCGVGHAGSQQMTAVATHADGTTIDVTKGSSTTWTSSNTSVATVDTDGNVVGVSGGAVTVTASYGGKSASAGCVIAP